jgi:hypothetical protein
MVLIGGLYWKKLAKYLFHGIAFSFLYLLLFIAWSFVLGILIVLGSFIGLIIALGILMLITGGLNIFLTSLLWFPLKTAFWDILVHGIVLFVVLLILNSIFRIVTIVFPGIAVEVVTLITVSFLNGFVAKKVAGWWEAAPEGIPEALEAEWRDKNL